MQGTAIGLFSLCLFCTMAARSHLEPSYYSVFSCAPEIRLVLQMDRSGQHESCTISYFSFHIWTPTCAETHVCITNFFRSLKVLGEKLVHLTDSKRMASHSKLKREERISLLLKKNGISAPVKELKTHLSLPLLRQFFGIPFRAHLLLLGR